MRARTVSEDSAGDEDDFSMSTKKQKTMEEILADSSDEEDDMEESKQGSKKGKKNKKSSQTWIKEGGEEVVDLLSPTASQAVSSSNPKAAKSVAEKSTKKEAFKINSDGKLIINDDDSDDEGKGPKRSARAMANMLEDSDDEETETFESLVSGKRRKMAGNSEVGSQKCAMSGIQSAKSGFSKYEPSGTGIHRNTAKEKDSGAEYRNKSGKGDVKRKGKHDPYAYIPLTHQALVKSLMGERDVGVRVVLSLPLHVALARLVAIFGPTVFFFRCVSVNSSPRWLILGEPGLCRLNSTHGRLLAANLAIACSLPALARDQGLKGLGLFIVTVLKHVSHCPC